MGHTHRPVLSEPFHGLQFLNPGAWLDGFRYGVVTPVGAELATWRG
jgi:predicted phosphodiesterase